MSHLIACFSRDEKKDINCIISNAYPDIINSSRESNFFLTWNYILFQFCKIYYYKITKLFIITNYKIRIEIYLLKLIIFRHEF